MPLPMPLVDPVTSAVLPSRLFPIPTLWLAFFDFLAPCRRGVGRAHHFHVQDAVLVVRRRGGLEAEPAVEVHEILLRADPERAAGPEALGARDRLAHELAAGARAARRRHREHAADGWLLVLHARRHEARVRMHGA